MRRRTVSRVGLALGALLAASPGTARAWHERGHRIVARIAWDELTPAQRGFVSGLLVQHPRFAEDFVARMPETIQVLSDRDPERRLWVFLHASTWPDLVKEEVKALTRQVAEAPEGPPRRALERRLAAARRFDNPGWHFDNKPIFVDPYALSAAPAASPAVGIQRALPAAIEQVGDAAAAGEERAVALAWVIHLLGDAHQPLHAASLFSAGALPQGDLGGNRVVVTTPDAPNAPTNLHAVWDGLFGADESAERALLRAIVAIHPRSRLAAELVAPAGLAVAGRVDLWLDESYRAADRGAYDPDLRAAVLLAAGGAATPVALDRRYLQAARKTARRRVALAGYRLADCLAAAAGG